MKDKIPLTITPEDLAKAQAHYEKTGDMYHGCLLCQVGRRHGLDVKGVAYTLESKNNLRFDLDEVGTLIMESQVRDWPQHVGKTVVLTPQ